PFLVLHVIAIICYSLISLEHSNDLIVSSDEDDRWKVFAKSFSIWIISIKNAIIFIFTQRQFIWFIPCYSLPLVIHRIFENMVLPFYAKEILHEGALVGILI